MIFAGTDFVRVHLVIRSKALRWEFDNFHLEVPFGFGLGHEFHDTFVNKVFNGPAGSIHQFSEFSHYTLIEFV
jgi:hypothetical protein